MDKKIKWKRKESGRVSTKSRRPKKFNFDIIQRPLGLILLGLRRILIGLGFLVLISVLFLTIFVSGTFNIRNFEIYGVNQLSEEEILFNLEKYKGENLFFQNNEEIASSVSSSSVYLKDIYVEKAAPDTLVLYVVERFPQAVMINFQGAFLVDQENLVVEVLSKTNGIDLNNEQRNILTGYGNENSEYIIKQIVEALPEDQRVTFDKNTTTNEQKRDKYNQILSDLEAKTKELFEQNSSAVSSSEFANLPRIFSYSNDSYSVSQSIDNKFTRLPIEIETYFRKKNEFNPFQFVWKDNFSLEVSTLEEKTFIFTDRREIWLQTQDLDFVLNYIRTENSDFKVIDLRSDVVSVD